MGWRGLRAVYDGDVDCWRDWVVGWRGLRAVYDGDVDCWRDWGVGVEGSACCV